MIGLEDLSCTEIFFILNEIFWALFFGLGFELEFDSDDYLSVFNLLGAIFWVELVPNGFYFKLLELYLRY